MKNNNHLCFVFINIVMIKVQNDVKAHIFKKQNDPTKPHYFKECPQNEYKTCVCGCVLQGAELSLRRLSEEKTALQLRLKQLEDDNHQLQTHTQRSQLELTRTLDILTR